MKKDKYYFSHDHNARSDPKLVKVAMKEGIAGIGIYWCIIEMLHEQNGYITLDNIENIAFELHTECERITNVLRNYELFHFEEDRFYSDRVLNNLKIRDAKSLKASDSAHAKWQKIKGVNANAMRTHTERNATVMLKKGNEKKEKEIKEEEDSSSMPKAKPRKKTVFVPPELQDVRDYFKANGYKDSVAIRAFDFYNTANWIDSHGSPVLNWKQKMISVWFKDENKTVSEQLYVINPETGFKTLKRAN